MDDKSPCALGLLSFTQPKSQPQCLLRYVHAGPAVSPHSGAAVDAGVACTCRTLGTAKGSLTQQQALTRMRAYRAGGMGSTGMQWGRSGRRGCLPLPDQAPCSWSRAASCKAWCASHISVHASLRQSAVAVA